VHAGLVPPAASVFLLGHSGAILMVTMLFMAVTSAGSAELVAVSSLFTYDIYKTYINKNASGEPLKLLETVTLLLRRVMSALRRLGLGAGWNGANIFRADHRRSEDVLRSALDAVWTDICPSSSALSM